MYSIDDLKMMKGKAEDINDIYGDYGMQGLLGQFLFNKHIANDKMDLDLANKRLNYRPNDKWDLYVQEDSPEHGGIQIGGKYRF